MTIRCSLTQKSGSPVKSHLYPQSFYPKDDSDEPMIVVGTNKGERLRRSRTGLYDHNLVTAEGEAVLAKIDQAAFNVLKPFEPVAKLVERSTDFIGTKYNPSACLLSKDDADTCLTFVASLLWRFHASGMREASATNLGQKAEEFRLATLHQDSTKIGGFSVLINKLKDDDFAGVLTPRSFREGDLRFYELVAGGFRFWAKADKRPIKSNLQVAMTEIGKPPVIMIRSFTDSRSFSNFARKAIPAMKHKRLPWKPETRLKYRI
ncbi:hypothetical protein ACQKH5_05550 [Hyphomonas sp. NPDC076900]|uniref:hypothetical protein n=1 Tax=unclassified Hyphomonas TaxID=2630699 RepID=UPI003CFE8241